MIEVLERGKARGELRADLDTAQAFLMIHGPMLQVALLGEVSKLGDPETPTWLVDTLLDGIAVDTPDRT